jgi:hypothetical protein
MADQQPSYAQLTRDIVQTTTEPLTVDEILARVNAQRPITTKNPQNTIRAAIQDSAMIVHVGAGYYGWKTRVIKNSILRYTLRESDLLMDVLQYSDELQDALCPTFFAKKPYQDFGPANVILPDGVATEFPFERLYQGVWGTHATPEFWEWLETQKADAGDHLIFQVLNAEERQYSLTFQSRRERDERAIAERNQQFLELIIKMLNRPYSAAPWEITTHALAHGLYRHPVPPDPLHEIWRDDRFWTPMRYLAEEEDSPEPTPDPLLSALFERPAQVYDPEDPPDLPREYDPNYGRRRPRPSQKAKEGDFTSCTFRIRHRALPEVWRDIALAEDQTLEDLHLAIQQAYGWYDDHLYSFFMNGKAWDKSAEIGSPWSEAMLHTHQVQVGQLDLKPGQIFVYLFDYGDGHEFDVQVIGINPHAEKGKYPRLVSQEGDSPPQYPDYDEDTGKPSWDPHSHLH